MRSPNPAVARPSFRRTWLILAALVPFVVRASEAPSTGAPHKEPVPANSKVHHPWAGGVDPRPTVTSITKSKTDTGDQLLLRWSGLTGPYKVQSSSDLQGAPWTAVGDQTTEQSLLLSVPDGNAFFRVQAPPPVYLSESTCRGCHPKAHNGVADTAHAHALDTLKRIGQVGNARCLPCHTVGYGLPGGFVSEAATPLLGGVQCENCHGPGGAHVADPGDLAARPVVSAASMVCGGCHTDFHHPTYDEWLEAGHSRVHPELVTGFMNTNIVAGQARMRACGACHSGGVRLAMLNGAEATPPVDLPAMPSGDVAANTPMTCTVCHTAHEKTPYGAQLRNPPYSTNFFSYSTSTNTNFTLQYQVDVNICAQCHNQRGAAWSSAGRPPHHSPQYNMLIGNIGNAAVVGVDLSALPQSSHREITKQCTHCHTHGHGAENPSEEDPVYTGHSFKPLPENCVPCHTVEEAEAFVTFRQRNTKESIAAVKALLDKWGETKSPEPLRAKYGKLAWEFSSVGQLSTPTNGTTVAGPTSSEQTLIPDEIKKSRFLLYMVEHDGSYGVHNGRFSTGVLNESKKLVEAKLAE
ncbi:MAG: hypothetical protein JNK85_12660 [Verrucomicrobiales bacterium]|nr:hypothetical protein [Verrucomicrobiales bacterium]